MKPAVINHNPGWDFILPDSIAEWDAITHWECERLASMQANLHPGQVLFDIGTEHGWLSAVYGGFVGYENMVLVEPSAEMWVDIHKTWAANSFADPAYCFPGFMSDTGDATFAKTGKGKAAKLVTGWPEFADVSLPESGPMAYRNLNHHRESVPTSSVDQFVAATGITPAAVTIDVEGAELLVLTGARKTLLEARPRVWCSVHPDLMERDFGVERVEELFEYMDSLGYKRDYLGTDHEQHHVFWPIEELASYIPPAVPA